MWGNGCDQEYSQDRLGAHSQGLLLRSKMSREEGDMVMDVGDSVTRQLCDRFNSRRWEKWEKLMVILASLLKAKLMVSSMLRLVMMGSMCFMALLDKSNIFNDLKITLYILHNKCLRKYLQSLFLSNRKPRTLPKCQREQIMLSWNNSSIYDHTHTYFREAFKMSILFDWVEI